MLTGREVAIISARFVGISGAELFSGSKCQDVARARAIAAWVLRRRWPSNPTGFPTIARLLKVHDARVATDIYRRAKRMRDEDEVFYRCCESALERAQRP